MDKRLTVEIPEQVHKEIKIKAIESNISLRKWVLQTIIERIAREEDYK